MSRPVGASFGRHKLGFVPPLEPTLGDAVPGGDEWLHESEHD